MITEAGGLIGNFTGEADYLYQREVVAGNPKVYAQLVQILAPYTRVIKVDEPALADETASRRRRRSPPRSRRRPSPRRRRARCASAKSTRARTSRLLKFLNALVVRQIHTGATERTEAAQRRRNNAFLCASSVLSVALW
jgi:myo-inositol-1(or 4)-monophosphatase